MDYGFKNGKKNVYNVLTTKYFGDRINYTSKREVNLK